MRPSSILAYCSFIASIAICANSPAAPPPPPATGTKPAPPAAGKAGYTGLGAASVSAETLAKFRPTPLPSELSRAIESLFDLRGTGAGQLTPDGKTLVFGWSVTGTPQIWRVTGDERFPVELTGGEDATTLVDITHDGQWIVVQRDRKGEENPGLYLQRVAGGPLASIQHKQGVQTQFQRLSRDGKWVYYRANDLKPDSYAIYRYGLGTGWHEPVFMQDGIWNLVDERGDGPLLLAKSTGELSSEIYEWDPAKKSLTPIIGQGEREEYDVAYGADTKRGEILVRTNKLGEFRRLYSLVAGKLTPVSPDAKWDVDRFLVDDARSRVLYEINDGGYGRVRALDAKTYKELPLPTLPEADHVTWGTPTPDGRFVTLAVDDGRHPLRSFLLDWKTRKLASWTAPSTPEVDSAEFVRAKLETYPARDGTPIPVLVRRSAECEQKACPVVVMFHGGPEGQSRPGFSVGAQLFLDGGFTYVEPNVRGSDGYGKSWLHADDGPKRLAVITDIEDAAKWARTRFAVAGKAPKVGIYGGSYGGYSTLVGMTMFAGAYDAGAAVVGMSSLVTFLKNTAPYRRMLRASEYGDLDKDLDALEKLSPIHYVDKVKSPLLVLQGASDPRVPVGEAIQMYDAVHARGVPAELVIYADEGHGAKKRENRVHMIGSVIAWFQKHLQ